jgi:predicted aminopeptidase
MGVAVRSRVAWLVWLILLISAAPALGQSITITKDAPTSERQLFDRAKKPPAMSITDAANFDAFTTCYYSGNWNFEYDSDVRSNGRDKSLARITIRGVSLKLKMNSVLYLPENVAADLMAHERGHQQIGERAYRRAEVLAKATAQPLIGRAFEAEGATPAAAEHAATHRAGQEWFAAYLAAIREPAQKVHDLYDEITVHGTNHQITESAAIDNAITMHLSRRSN